jgi:hypothetical protein
MKQTIQRLWQCETSGPLGGWLEIFLHSSRDSGCAAGGIGIYCDKVKLKVPLQEAYKFRSFTYFCGKV